MRKLILILSILMSTQVFALKDNLKPAVAMVENCLATEGVLLCNDNITELLKTVGLDSRGEFVHYLKDVVAKNETEKVITNLYEKLQELVPIYEKLDGCDQWSCSDLKYFLADVSIRYIKVSPVSGDLYVGLYKAQAVQGGRYAILMALSEKANHVTALADMDEIIKFAEFAKDYSRSIKDELYLYEAGVSIIRKMTLASIKLRPGHEGIYSITFDNAETNKDLKIDSIAIMESSDRDALVVNFVSSQARIIKVSFNEAGLLGNTFFSNADVYNNDNNPEIQSPFFKMVLDRDTQTIKGIFSSARYGKSAFTGKLVKSNLSVYEQANVPALDLSQLVGKYKVKVGNYDMTLVIGKRADDRTLYEASLVDDNALITFSKVSLDSDKGVLSLVDSNNTRKLTLGVVDFSNQILLKGQFLNAPLAKILDVISN